MPDKQRKVLVILVDIETDYTSHELGEFALDVQDLINSKIDTVHDLTVYEKLPSESYSDLFSDIVREQGSE